MDKKQASEFLYSVDTESMGAVETQVAKAAKAGVRGLQQFEKSLLVAALAVGTKQPTDTDKANLDAWSKHTSKAKELYARIVSSMWADAKDLDKTNDEIIKEIKLT